MEQAARSTLQRATQQIRRLLEEEFAEQLEGTFDILATGKILPSAGKHLDARQRLTRQKLVDAIEHIKAGGKKPQEAVEEYTREAAFTFLNRFVALRMLEARGLLQECISKGDQSSGFKEFIGLAPGLASLPDGGYRLYLECLFDELSVEVKVLFDRRDSASLLWPRRGALTELLDILGQTDLAEVWGEDETIGWVYQYFNSGEERKKMRDESQAPRNSRELAVRNQFFTPRYVVEFLTDNTLGRIWYEMRKGQTRLVDECRYLVRRPGEVFLSDGQEAPADKMDVDLDLSQEELLKGTSYIPHRPQKDPRDLKILDPACGSGHFLLYAFDLLLWIYEEAWRDTAGPKSEFTGKRLSEDYPELQQLHAALPSLVLAHNLHGIDIDPRAAQIAALALWMRGQRAFNEFGIPGNARAAIAKSNIVCAEPMPGEAGFLDEFIKVHLSESAEGRFLASLVRKVFESMKLAGEAGSLLKIEEDIADEVAKAKKQWLERPAMKQKTFFDADSTTIQQKIDLTRGIPDASFWEDAERSIYDALRKYSEQAERDGGFQRQLFASDAARGFAFVDLCNNRFDVVVMNPPFGAYASASVQRLAISFPDASKDLYPCFIERWVERCEMLGAITNRTGLIVNSVREWRQRVLLGSSRLRLVGDLGLGVLDALVETAMYVVDHRSDSTLVALDFLNTPKNQVASTMESVCADIISGTANDIVTIRDLNAYRAIPRTPIAYRVPHSLLRAFFNKKNLEDIGLVVRVTNPTSDSFRYLRLRWEVPRNTDSRWKDFAKGGEYSPYYSDLDLKIDWDEKRSTYNGYVGSPHRPLTRPASLDHFFNAGITWSERTASRFSPRVLPRDAIFSNVGPYAGGANEATLLVVLGVTMSAPFQSLLEMFLAGGDATSSGAAARHYGVGDLREVPYPALTFHQESTIRESVREIIALIKERAVADETSGSFAPWKLKLPLAASLDDVDYELARQYAGNTLRILECTLCIDKCVSEGYGMVSTDDVYIEQAFGKHPLTYQSEEFDALEAMRLMQMATDALIAECVTRQLIGRFITVKSHYSDRHLEVASHRLGVSAMTLKQVFERYRVRGTFRTPVAELLLSFLVGVAFGRWNAEILNHSCEPIDEGIFGKQRDPQSSHEFAGCSTLNAIYVDDMADNNDLATACKRVWESAAIESSTLLDQALEELLGTGQSATQYFRFHFFSSHLSKFTRHRRAAPVYWQLATPSASYSVWLYYHRLTRDTFFQVLNEYVKPKWRHEQQKLGRMQNDAGASATRSQRKDIEDQEKFVAELAAMTEEVERIAPLWNPDINDGVIVNFAPLWRLVPQHKAWQKECKECWEQLVAGEYDWAHLAMYLWPERVVPKCVDDASLAIAHGLEGVFWEEDERNLFRPKAKPDGGWQSVIDQLVKDRTSPAVKAALKSLLEAPVAGAATKSTRRRRGAAT